MSTIATVQVDGFTVDVQADPFGRPCRAIARLAGKVVGIATGEAAASPCGELHRTAIAAARKALRTARHERLDCANPH